MKLFSVLLFSLFMFFVVPTFAQISAANVEVGAYTPGSTIAATFSISPSTCIAIGNKFNLELSDASGNFGSTPNIIGSYDGFYSTFVNGVIPMGTPAGTGYKVRIRSTTNPAQNSNPSAAFEIRAGTAVQAKITSEQLNISNTEVFGQCSGSENYKFYLQNESTTSSTVTAQITNELTVGTPTNITFDSNLKEFTASLAHYTIFTKAIMPDGTLATKAYFIVNNQTITAFSTVGNNVVCLPGGALSFLIDVTGSTGIQNNFPGNTYKIDWGDGSNNNLTFCDLKTGIVQHSYTTSSCGQTYKSGATSIYNAFGINVQLSSPFCGNLGTPVSTTAKVVNVTQNSFTGPSVACKGTSTAFNNNSVLGQNPTNTSAACLPDDAKFKWFVDGVIQAANVNKSYVFNFTFTTNGTHKVRLESTGSTGCPTVFFEQTICVQNPPQPSFTLPTNLTCAGSTITPTNTSVIDNTCGSNIAYSWTVSPATGFVYTGGTNANSETPQFIFNTAGTYTIQLGAKNASCNIITTSLQTIVVNALPTASLSPNIELCNLTTLAFNNADGITKTSFTGTTVPETDTYTWSVSGGNFNFAASSNANSKFPSIQFLEFKSYTITVTHKNNCGSVTKSQVVTFTTAPIVNAGLDMAICYNDPSVTLNGNITGTVTGFAWMGGNGTFSPNRNTLNAVYNPTLTEKNSGSVELTLRALSTLPAPCNVIEDKIIITIKPKITINSASTKQICNGSALNYTPTSPITGTTYTWTASGSASAEGFNPSGSGASITDVLTNSDASNNASVTYIITPTADGCNGDSFTLTVTINPTPVLTATAANTTICSAQNALINLSSSVAGTKFTWTTAAVSGVTGNTSNVTATTTSTINQLLTNNNNSAATVNYIITPISSNGCSGTSVNVAVVVEPKPTIANAGPNESICNSTSYTLKGNQPSVGTGKWTEVSTNGDISFDDDTKFNAVVSGLQASKTYIFKWKIGAAGSCTPSESNVTISVNPLSVGGTTTGATTVCAGINTGSITLSGQVGSIIKWESSTDGTTWTAISGTANITTYNFANRNITTSYRAVVQSGVCAPDYSSVTVITVKQPVTVANAGTDQTLCNSTSATLAGNNPLVGTGTWTLTSGQTGVTFVDATLYNTTVSGLVPGQSYTFKWTIDGQTPCSPSFDEMMVKIDPLSVGGTTIGAITVCSGSNTGSIALSGNVGAVLRWESSTDGTTWTTISGTTNITTYNFANRNITTSYRAVVQSGVCAPDYSSVTVITVKQPATVANAGTNQTLCNATSATLAGNNPLVGTGTWTLTSGQTGVTFVDATLHNTAVNGLVPGETYAFQWKIDNGAPCSPSTSNVTISVNPLSVGGTTTGATTVCAGINTGSIILSGQVGSIIKWESSTDGTTWTAISGTANITTYNFANRNITTSYRAVVQSGVCAPDYSSVTVINVKQPVTVANAGTDQTLCNANSATLTGNTPLIGTGTWTLTSGQTGVTFVDATLHNTVVNGLVPGQSYNFRWTIEGAPCSPSISNVTITVNPLSVGGTTTGATTVCSGLNTGTITLSGQVGNIIRWESSTNGTTWSTIASSSSTLTYSNMNATTRYRAVVQSGVCAIDYSSETLITVKQPVTVANAGTDQTLCSANSVTLAGNNPLVGIGTWTLTSGQTGVTFVNSTLYNTAVNGLSPGQTYTFKWTIDGQTPCTPSSDDVVIENLEAIANNLLITSSAVACTNQTITISGGLPTGGNNSYTYVWQSSANGGTTWNTIIGQTSKDITLTVSSNLAYRRIITSGTCSSTSNIINITALPILTNNTIGNAQTICLTTNANPLTGSQPNGGDGSNYSYAWQKSTDNGVNWTNITAANTKDYNPGAITETTLYRRVVSSGPCIGTLQSISNTIKITVNLNAKADFTFTNDTGCIPFTINSSNIKAIPYPSQNANYTWYANGVLLGTGINFPGYTISTTNSSVVIKLVTASSLGCITDEKTHTFSTRADNVASFTQSANSGCGPLSVTFTNTSTSLTGATFNWDFGNGVTSALANPGAIIFNADPTGEDKEYTVTLTLTNPCGNNTFTRKVLVKGSPISTFSPDNTLGCSPFTVKFSNTTLGNHTSYTFDFGDGNTLVTTTKNLVSHIYNTTTVQDYTVKMLVTSDCGTSESQYTIRVMPNTIDPQLVVNSSQLSGCAPLTVDFFNNTKGATSYKYTFGDGSIVTSNTLFTEKQTHTFTKAGVYTVELFATNGCSNNSITKTITVFDQPLAVFKADQTIGCTGLAVKFNNNSINGVSYLWDFGDGTTSSQVTPTHVYSAKQGLFTVKLTAFNNLGCPQTTTITDYIKIVSAPTANFSISPAAIISIPDHTFKFTNESTNNPQTYQWNFGDGDVSSLKDPTHTYADTGKYLVKMKAYNDQGCVDSTQKYVQIVGVPGYVYVPNSFMPGSNNIVLQKFAAIGVGIKSWRMRIFNKLGQVVWETTKLADGKPEEGWDGTYNGTPQPQGVYFWKIEVYFVNGSDWKGMSYGKSTSKQTGEIYLIR